MAYTPPLGNVAHIDLAVDSGGAYTPPAGNVAHIDFAPTDVLIGRTATISQGTITPSITVALVGQSMTAQQGGITATGRGANLIGQSATISQGTIVPHVRTPVPIIWANSSSNITLSGSPQRQADSFVSATPLATSNGAEEEVGGKRYFEVGVTGKKTAVGITDGFRAQATANPLGGDTTGTDDLYSWALQIDSTAGQMRTLHDGVATAQGAYTYVAGAPIQVAVDFTAGKIWFGYNGTWVGGGNPALDTNPTYTGVSGFAHPVLIGVTTGANNVCTELLRVDGNDFAFPLNVFGNTGYLPWQDSDVAVTTALTGLQATISQGTMVPSTIVLSGQQATISGGTLTPSITNGATLTGLQATAINGYISGVVNAGNVIVFLQGLQANTQQGSMSPTNVIGTSVNTLAPFPRIVSSWSVSGAYDPTRTGAWTYNHTFIEHERKLVGAGEVANYDIYGNFDIIARIDYAVDPELVALDWSSTLTEAWDYQNHGDGELATYELNSSTFEPWYLNQLLVSPFTGSYRYNRSIWNGGWFSLGLDGSKHWVYSRSYWDGTTYTHYLPYQNSARATQAQVITSPMAEAMGVYAHTINNAYVFYVKSDGSGHYLPTYRRWNGTAFGTETSIGSWTGSTALSAQPLYLTVARAGYGDTIYITYQALGDSGNRYVGLIVMNAVTETVTSHVLTQITAASGYTGDGAFPNADTWNEPSPYSAKGHRPIAHVGKLSGGTSVTQFLFGYAVVHLSWTSGTATAPTLTLKSWPSLTKSGVGPGWETLEVRGDVAQHILYEVDYVDNNKLDVYSVQNDATGSGSSWSSELKLFTWGSVGQPLWPTSVAGSARMFLGGYGVDTNTWLFFIPENQRNTSSPSPKHASAWIDWWSGLTVSAQGEVGTCTVTIIPGVVLTGQVATISQGALKPSITVALTGLSTTVLGGTLAGGVPTDADVTPTGLSATVSRGTLVPVISVTLSGLAATASGGLLGPQDSVVPAGVSATAVGGALSPTITVALTGLSTTISGGLFGRSIAVVLAGQQATASGGTLARSTANSTTLTGLQAIITGGNFTPVVAGVPAGLAATATGGALYATLAVPLTSLSAVINRGSLGFFYDCNLFPSGVQAIGVVGTIGPMSPLPLAGTSLWTNTGQADLFTHVPVEPLNNDA